MRDFLASLWEFALKLISHVYVVVVAVVGGILGIVSGVGSDFQTPGASPLVPLWVWLPLFGIGYGVAVIWAFHDVRMERDAVQRRATTAETGLENKRTELADQQARHQRALDAQREDYEKQLAEAKAPPKTGLEVVIDKEIQTPFPGVGLILEIEFRVTNHDPMEHALFRSMRDAPFQFGPKGTTEDPEQTRLRQAFGVISERRRGDDLPKSVRAGETVRGVYVVEFDWNPARKLPDYTLIISDGRREFPVRPHGAAESTPAKPGPPAFELRSYTGKPYENDDWLTSHFIGVKNPPGQPERRVRVIQVGMDPEPRHTPPYSPRPAFPYPVPPRGGGNSGPGVTIRSGQEESWFLGDTGTGGDEKMNVFGFNVTNGARLSWQLDPDESWRLSYRIACDGVAEEMEFSIVVDSQDGKTILVRQEG